MKKEVGLWIDHRQAVIVTLQDKTEAIEYIDSHVEKPAHYLTPTHVYIEGAPQDNQAEIERDHRIEAQMLQYYDTVIARLHDATAVLIMGPDETKLAFQKRMEAEKLDTKILGVEAADKMTDELMIAKIRRNFELYQYTH